MINLLHGDCLELMKSIPDKSIDMVLTDPPYKVYSGGHEKGFSHKYKNSIFKNNDGKIFKHNEIDFYEWALEIYRVLKDSSHFYTMTNNKNLLEDLSKAKSIGFDFHNLLLWKKNNILANRYYMKNCEYILFFKKGKAKTINNPSTPQLLEFNHTGNIFHPTQKPIELMSLMIKNSSKEKDIILDPFMGSGSTGVAAVNLNRKFIGIEKDDKYFEIAKNRIEDAWWDK